MRRSKTNPRQGLGQVLALSRQLSPTVRVREYRQGRGRQAWPQAAHAGVEVAWVKAGGTLYRVGKRELAVSVGTAIVVPAQIEHATSIEENTLAGSIRLDAGLIEQVGLAMDRRLGQDPLLLEGAERLLALGDLLRAEANIPGPGTITVVEALAEALAVLIHRSLPETSKGLSDTRIRAAVDQIESSFDEPLTVEDLARSAAMSRFHFSRVFRDQLGMSPYQYLTKTRVERAAELLRCGHRSVTEAAFTVGFQDLGRFSRAFRRHLGVLPSDLLQRGA